MSDPDLDELLAEHARREARADEGGGPARLARQHRLGRLGARERIALLVDAGSFVELGRHVLHRHEASSELLAANRHPADGVVCGLATVEGREVAVYAHDPTVLRGALGSAGARKLCRLMDMAAENGVPLLALADSDGARIDEVTDAIEGYGAVIERTVLLHGKVPQITLVCGLCVGAAAYTATLTDWVAMVPEHGFMCITGAKVTRAVTGEDVDIADLGGAALHATKTGACHAVVADERAGIEWMKGVLRYLDSTVASADPPARAVVALETLVPTSPRRAYDMRKVVDAIFDEGSTFELSGGFAPNLLTVLARLGGRAVAVVASQPMKLGGCLDVDASKKGAHFVSWANLFGIPVITLVDVPGYLPGRKQEEAGILPVGATLLTAYGNLTVPSICLVVRKSFGGASVLSYAADVRLALPTARIAPMGADAAVDVTVGPKLEDATEAEKAAREARRAQWLAQHDNAWSPAEHGYVDQVVAPRDVRSTLHATLARLKGRGVAVPRPLR
jgi:acetyl-CoA carboxylase carboxyltransferase component